MTNVGLTFSLLWAKVDVLLSSATMCTVIVCFLIQQINQMLDNCVEFQELLLW